MDLLNDQQFLEYRVKEIEEGVLVLRQLYLFNVDKRPDMFLGAMEMLRRIINLPEKMIPEDSSQKEQAKILKAKGLAVFESRMMRIFLEEE